MENGNGNADAMPAGIVEKIRKLLRLAHDEGATPEEAALAGERAQALLMRYKLERASVGDLYAEAQAATVDPVGMSRWDGVDVGLGKSVPSWWSILLHGVSESTGCKSVLHRYGRAGWAFSIIGRSVDVLVARELLDHLTAATLRLTRAYSPARHEGWGRVRGAELATARKAFRFGCASRISQRLQDAAAERAAASADCRALVLVDRQAVAKYMAEKFPRLSAGRRARLRGGAEHYAAGRRAGDGVGLQAQRKVTGGGPRGLLS